MNCERAVNSPLTPRQTDLGGAVELILGMSMAPTSIGMVLVEGENADGVTVEEDNIEVVGLEAADDSPTLSATDQVIAAILGTREGAVDAGSRLMSTGVTWTDQVEAVALRDALATRKIENVVLVSAFLAAAALAQTVGSAIGYQRTAMLFVEPDTATLAVVDSADGSVTDVHRQALSQGDTATELVDMLAGLQTLPSRPDGVFVVGCGVDVAPVKPQLEAATTLAVSVPEEPEMALARGAALASANAPLFASSTAALAYAQDPGTGAVDPFAVSPGYLAIPDEVDAASVGREAFAYSAVADEDAAAETVVLDPVQDLAAAGSRQRTTLLTGSAVAATAVTAAALALVVSLAINIRSTTVALRPVPGQSLIVPTAQAPAPPAPARIGTSTPSPACGAAGPCARGRGAAGRSRATRGSGADPGGSARRRAGSGRSAADPGRAAGSCGAARTATAGPPAGLAAAGSDTEPAAGASADSAARASAGSTQPSSDAA